MSQTNQSPSGSFLFATFFLISAAAHAAISVGPSGSSGILTFDTQPAAGDFATYVLTGNGATYIDPAGMDAGAQTVDAATVINQLGSVAQATPGTFAGGMQWNSTTLYLQSRPTTSGTNAASVMKATLQNDSGGDLTEVTISYDFALFNAVGEEVPGYRVFWSLSGAPNSWTLLPILSGNETAGTQTESLGAIVWPAGSTLYLLWADDNDDGLSDQGQTIDNFMVSGISTVVTPLTITSQPQSTNVAERGTATFSVTVSGSPQYFSWYRDGVLIPGAVQSTYTIPSVVYPTDNNAQFQVVVSNSLTVLTSAPVAVLTVTPDTTPPAVVSAVGNLDPTSVTVNLSEAIDVNTVSEGTVTVFITGTNPDDGLLTTGYLITNNNRTLIFTTDPREYGSNYSIRVTGLLDASSQQNPLSPDPTFLPLAQTIPLIGFDTNNEWKWDLNNGDRFGTGWETVGFDDSTWPSGPAGLGLDASVNGVPILTALPYLADSAPAYFRRHFFLPTGTNGVTLTLRDVVEDGAVYYINGQEVFRHNVSPGVLTFGSRATLNQTDPTPIQGPFDIPTFSLVPGDNVIAVVVLQNGNTSSDIELAAELSATIPGFSVGPPVINVQPQSQTINEGQNLTLTVAADGAQPMTFQWRKGGSDIPGATGASYTVNPALPADSGTYDVVVSNGEGSQTSATATVTVVPDTTGPTFVSAIGQTNLNEIVLRFSEAVNIDTAEDVGNYNVSLTGGGGTLTINVATVVNGTNIILNTSERVAGQNYTITLANITDNAVARNPATPGSLPVASTTILLAPDDVTLWRFNAESNNLDGTGWELPSFNDAAWLTGLAGFTTSNNLEVTTNGFDLRTTNMLAPSVGGPIATYYRVNFNFPGDPAGAVLSLVGVVDDGLVAYINGVEAGRLRLTNASPVSFTNLATGSGPESGQTHLPLETLVLTNLTGLVTGNNLLAIQLHQNSATSSDAVLSVQLLAQVGTVTEPPTGPRLNISRNPTTGQITVSWTGAGTLRQATTLLPAGTVWTDVPGNPNPYVFTPGAGNETRFFSLWQ